MFWGSVVSPHPFPRAGLEMAMQNGDRLQLRAPVLPRVGEHSLEHGATPRVLVSSRH